MRIGYCLFPQGNVAADPQTLADGERMARELALLDLVPALGFDELWVTEHHFGDYLLSPSPLQMLAYAAGRYPGLTLGTMVVVLPWNDPLRVVEQVVLLDHLAGGRLLIGFGKGEAGREFAAFGMDLAEGRRRFEEHLDAVVAGLRTGVVPGPDGREVTVRPGPFAPFDDRIYMAAGSPQSLDRCARAGLGLVRIALRSWDEVASQVERHRALYVETLRAEPPPTVTLVFGYVDRDPVRAAELGAEYARRYRLSAIDHYELGADADAELEQFAQAQLYGTPAEVIEKARVIAERTRTEHLVVAFRYAGVPYDDAEASMRLFAAEVAPALRREAVVA